MKGPVRGRAPAGCKGGNKSIRFAGEGKAVKRITSFAAAAASVVAAIAAAVWLAVPAGASPASPAVSGTEAAPLQGVTGTPLAGALRSVAERACAPTGGSMLISPAPAALAPVPWRPGGGGTPGQIAAAIPER